MYIQNKVSSYSCNIKFKEEVLVVSGMINTTDMIYR